MSLLLAKNAKPLLVDSKDFSETSLKGTQVTMYIFKVISVGHDLHILFIYYIYPKYSDTLTHFILNKLSPTIYWKSPISILGMSGNVI